MSNCTQTIIFVLLKLKRMNENFRFFSFEWRNNKKLIKTVEKKEVEVNGDNDTYKNVFHTNRIFYCYVYLELVENKIN